MAKQKTFWKPLKGRKVDHLWVVGNSDSYYSVCGLIWYFDSELSKTRTDTPCKNCQRAIRE